jgi:hypothetical protein
MVDLYPKSRQSTGVRLHFRPWSSEIILMRTNLANEQELCLYSDWDDDHLLGILKHVLDHHEMPPGSQEDEKAAVAARIVCVKTDHTGRHSVHISLLGEILFCDLVCHKNGEN